MKVRKVVIPAAGLGTRLYPLTRAQPKEMLPILDKPVIHYVVEDAVNAGLDEILIIVGKGKEAIINYFDKSEMDSKNKDDYGLSNFPDIYFVRQKEQKGLANAVSYAKNFVGDEPFVLLLGDTIYKVNEKNTVTSQLLKIFEKEESPVIGLERVEKDAVKNYGIIKGDQIRDRLWRVRDMVEKPDPEKAPSNLAATAQYVLTSDIFSYIKKIGPGKSGEYQLTDALRLLCEERPLMGYEVIGKRYDVGLKELWVKTFLEFAREDPRFSNF